MRRATAARVASHPRSRVARHTQEILGSLARILAMSGEAPRALATEFAKICRLVNVPRLTEELQGASNLDHIHTISHWYSDPDYLDATGLPRPLPFSGERSVTQLVNRLPQADPAAVLETLLKLGAVRKEGRRYRPVGRVIIYGHRREEYLFFLVNVLRGMLRTIEHNASSELKDRLPDRSAFNPRFPVRDLPAFYARLRRYSTEFLRHADSAMYSKERRGRTEPTTHLGVTVIAFEDPLVTGHTATRKGRASSRAARGGRRA